MTHSPQGGGSATSTTIPVTLSVVPGLVAPPNQTKTLNADTTAASLSGSVAILRGDNVAQATPVAVHVAEAEA